MISTLRNLRDVYDVDALGSLFNRTGIKLIYKPEIDSTMSVKIPQIADNQSIVILTDHQTRGKGRQARVWSDKAYSSIIFSLIIKINPSNIAVLADLSALRLCESLNKIAGHDLFKIKYPNDIVAGNKKVCGILVKNIYTDSLQYKYTNIGIGINAHYGIDELSEIGSDYGASSLDSVLGRVVDRTEVFREIILNFRNISEEAELFDFEAQAGLIIDAKWKDLSDVYSKEIKILKNGKIIDGGKVVNTGIGRGIELQTPAGYKWFSLFESEMSVRVSH